MHWSQCGPATPGLQTQSPLSGLQYVEPARLHMQAAIQKGRMLLKSHTSDKNILMVLSEALNTFNIKKV